MEETIVQITVQELERLQDDAMKYQCLRNCGVDNWRGWDDAMDMYREWIGEEE